MPTSAIPASGLQEHIYSARPWLIEADDEAFASLFAHCPEELFAAHEFHSFGRYQEVFRIEEGCFATCYGRNGAWDWMTGLFLPGALLGAPKAVLHPGKEMPLVALALAPVRARRMQADRFRALLEEDPALALRFFKRFSQHQEAQLEGMLVNDADAVPLRLAKLFLMLATSHYAGMEATPTEMGVYLPISPYVSEIAIMVHATRSATSRILGHWEKTGLLARPNGRLWVSHDLIEQFQRFS